MFFLVIVYFLMFQILDNIIYSKVGIKLNSMFQRSASVKNNYFINQS